MLPLDVLLKLKRWNTPSIYNGWEQITRRSRLTGFNIEETRDFMPEFGPMVGYAITVKIKPSEPSSNPMPGKNTETILHQSRDQK